MKQKILIVEDEAILFLEIKDLLEDNGYDVIGYADNGYTKSYEEALHVIKKEAPDMVLLDVVLQGVMNGIQLAEKLNKYSIPFIYLSANSDSLTLSEAQKTNPNTFLIKSKPVDEKQLLVTLQMALAALSPIQKEGVWVQKQYGSKGMKTEKNDKVLLRFEDIHYVSSSSKKNNILFGALKDGKPIEYVLRNTLDFMEIHLPVHFLRIHGSYIVNLNKITGRKNGKTLLTDYKELKIGISYEAKAKKVLDAYFIK